MHSIKSFFKHKSSSPPKVGGAGDGDDTPRPCTSSSGCSAQSDPDSSDSVSPPVTELRSMYSAFSDSDKSGFDRERVPQISASGESELEVMLPVSGCLTSGAKSKKRKAVTVPKKGSKPRKYPKALCYYTNDTAQKFKWPSKSKWTFNTFAAKMKLIVSIWSERTLSLVVIPLTFILIHE